MKYFLSALYGIIQGLTEFLPVSSSGHLSAFQNVFGKIDESMSGVTYTLLLHVGTLAAVLLVYYKDVWKLIKSFFSLISKLCTGKFKYKTFSDDEKFFCMLFVALIPLLLGAVLEGTVEFLSGYTLAIGVLWILNGFILLASEKIKKETINYFSKDDMGVDKFNRFILGWQAGARIEYSSFYLGLSYEGNISNLYKYTESGYKEKINLGYFDISLGYKF